MRKGGSGGLIAGIIAVIGIIIFFLSRGSFSALFQTIGIIVLVVVILAVIGLILLIVFASKASKNNPTGKNMSSSRNRLNEEQSEIINNGRKELMTIRRKLVTIKNSKIRTKGNAVCASMDRVFKILKEKPEKIPSTRQFLNYYIPTVSKVIQKYQRLEANGVPTADMTDKILKFLDDVDAAMDKQCTHLYEDDKLDMTVDMEAMTIAIQRDGLLDSSDFQIPGSGGLSSVADDFRQQAQNVAEQQVQTTPPQEAAQPVPQTTPPQQVQTSPPQPVPQTTPPQNVEQTMPPKDPS